MIEFRVIGELRTNPGHLLLLDCDGQCYDYDISLDEIVPVDPGEAWAIDVIEEGAMMMVVPADKIVADSPVPANVS